MDKTIPADLKEYGQYINKFRAFPDTRSGMKIVQTRILYSAWQILGLSNAFTKCAKVVGHCIGNIHPHGDGPTYEALVGMVNNGILIGKGNFGNYHGFNEDPAAAYRYTEMKINPYVLDMFKRYMDVVDIVVKEHGEEPLAMPLLYPMCLLNTTDDCQGIGFAYKTWFPHYKVSDLKKRLDWLLHHKGDPTIPEPIIVPSSVCPILNTPAEFQKILTTGTGKITYVGKITVRQHDDVLVVSAIPPNKNKKAILGALEEEMKSGLIGWKNLSKTSCVLEFKVQKPRTMSVEQAREKLQKVLTSSVTYKCNCHNDAGDVITMSIDALLLSVYNYYVECVTKKLQLTISENNKKIAELNFIEYIKPFLSEALANKVDDIDAVINTLHDKTKISKEIISGILSRYAISYLFKVSTDTGKLQQQTQLCCSQVSNIHSHVWMTEYNK